MWPLLGPSSLQAKPRLSFASALISPHQPFISFSAHLRLSSPPSLLWPFSGHSIFASFIVGFCLILTNLRSSSGEIIWGLFFGYSALKLSSLDMDYEMRWNLFKFETLMRPSSHDGPHWADYFAVNIGFASGYAKNLSCPRQSRSFGT